MSRLIALCGNPGSGKSEAAKILTEEFGYAISDDGLPLREIAMDHLGLTYEQCFTQEGKLQKITLNDREWTCRQVLGEIGNAFEEKFGADIIPLMSYMGQNSSQKYVMASVRREQGRFWASKGALVIEISNYFADQSPYEFDRFNRAHVHRTIINDYKHGVDDPVLARAKLRQALIDTIGL